jgi:hypothetical protein
MDEQTLLAFKAICDFVEDLSSVFGNKHKPLKLYRRLSSKTTISNTKAMGRHIDIFKVFSEANSEAISEKDANKLQIKVLKYSDAVYIDMAYIFRLAENEIGTSPVIWRHLLTISAIVNPSDKAKELLKADLSLTSGASASSTPTTSSSASGAESDLLSGIFSKVEKSFGNGDKPMDIGSIMSSGVFTEVIQDIQGKMSSGELDIGKLFGAMQGMMGSLGSQLGDDPESKQALNMINSMSGMFGAGMGGGAGGVNFNGANPLQAMFAGSTSSTNADPDKISVAELHERAKKLGEKNSKKKD